MNKRYTILGLIGIFSIIAIFSMSASADIIGTTPCNYFNIPLFRLSGYSCTEQSGTIKTYLDPGAYTEILKVYGTPTQTFSGR